METLFSFVSILLAFLFGSAELLAKIDLRLRHRFNSLMHLTEALIVGFLALTENAHYAVKPLLACDQSNQVNWLS